MDGSDSPHQSAWIPCVHFSILLVISGLLFFSHIACPLQEPEEPRYAEIPREMLESGQSLVPLLHGLPYYDKPPLLYWLVMTAYELFDVNDWAARLVSSGAAFLTVFVVYYWGTRTISERAGFMAAVMLCLAPRFVYLGRLLTMNSLLCLWVVTALAFAHIAIQSERLRRWHWVASALACGLGILTKGPVAFALISVPVLATQVLDRRFVRPSLRAWAIYLLVALGVAAPWFLAMAARDPEFLGYFFWKQNLVRYLAPFDHAKPVWYYVDDIVLGMLPWSLIGLFFLKHLYVRRGEATSSSSASLRFAFLAFAWCFTFFSLAGSKRAGYVLPAMPALALALGGYLDLASEAKRHFRTAHWAWAGAATFTVLLILVDYMLPGYARRFAMRGQVHALDGLAVANETRVVCYPRGWDSVNFYLRRTEIRVYTEADRDRLISDLSVRQETLAFVKSGEALTQFLNDLPINLKFVPQGRQGNVAVGWVRERSEMAQSK
jgi:4-amino-4-deoxy-L-arabinose transferase-like glycosyltransferase